MDVEEFRIHGKQMIDYICDYMIHLETKRVSPNIQPGYLHQILPDAAPAEPEDWNTIMHDIDTAIMPGMLHWQHPRFHAYFPAGNSYPSILGDMLSDAIGCLGFSWAASPACTELETIVMDWFGKAIGLPSAFLAFHEGSQGGGVIQSSASECILICMLAARNQAIQYLKTKDPDLDDSGCLPKLIAYCSKEAHSCVEKAALILLIKIRILEPDENSSLRGETLQKAMADDEALGLTPFFVTAVAGTTGCCSFDNILEMGEVCKSRPCTWMHVDGAYAGNAFICPELRHFMTGIEYVDSFNINPNKWLLVNFDCSCMWVRNKRKLTHAWKVYPFCFQHDHSEDATDYRHWGVPLSRRFRSLKLWFVLRNYGISGLQAYIRNHIKLAKYFESLVKEDNRFEVVNEVHLALVCFRLNDTDQVNQRLLANINASGKLHMIPAMVKNKYIIRFCVVAEHANKADIDLAWNVIREFAMNLLESTNKTLSSDVVFKPTLTKEQSTRHSFTRRVSREIYRHSIDRGSLGDGATPILVLEDKTDSHPDDEKIEPKNEISVKDCNKCYTIEELPVCTCKQDN